MKEKLNKNSTIDLSTFAPGSRKSKREIIQTQELPSSTRIMVVGAGVFGGWTALQLLRKGYKVSLVDQWGPGNSQSSSGGESRLIRAIYGDNRKYFDMTIQAWEGWRELERVSNKKVLNNTGVLWLFHNEGRDTRKAISSIMDERDWPYEILEGKAIPIRYPVIETGDLESVLIEKKAGYLLARHACQVVCDQFVQEGGNYEQAVIERGTPASNRRMGILESGVESMHDIVVFASGPWLPKIFPEILDSKLTVSRQEIHYFGIPAEHAGKFMDLPPWVDWEPGVFFYGIPSGDHRGFKVACDIRGEDSDPSTMERIPQQEWVKRSREFLSRRFPLLERSPVIESRVCQYTNTRDGNFLLDRHPEYDNVWLLGGGSGHGFKHGPALGKLASEIISGNRQLDPDFVIPD